MRTQDGWHAVSAAPQPCRRFAARKAATALPDDLACRDATLGRTSAQTEREALRHFDRDRDRVLGGRRRARLRAPVRGSDMLAVATSQTCATTPWPPPPYRPRPRASAAPLSVVRPFALASNESSDTGVLSFTSQINYAASTPAHNCPLKAEVIYCVRGAMTPPCGVPVVRGTTLPSSICTGAFSQRSMYSRRVRHERRLDVQRCPRRLVCSRPPGIVRSVRSACALRYCTSTRIKKQFCCTAYVACWHIAAESLYGGLSASCES